MYVGWSLEFIWRLLIQGPLMVINFFTTNGNIDKIFGNVGFTNESSGIVGSLINISLLIGIIMFLFIILFAGIFIFKISKILIVSNGENTKNQIVELIKEMAKSLSLIVVFSLFFGVLFVLFDALMLAINNFMIGIAGTAGDVGQNGEPINGLENIPSWMYWTITNVPHNGSDTFLPPRDFFDDTVSSAIDSVNFLFSIIFVTSFSFILIWMVWSIFQKMLEIVFLYISFPISIAFSLETQKICWKIWLKEIFNKIVTIFVLTILLRCFLYLFSFIFSTVIASSKGWVNHNDVLYVSLITTLALGGSIIFVSKLFSTNTKENIGIIGSINSFEQTRNFITKNRESFLKGQVVSQKVNLEPINSNINSLRSDLSRISNNIVDYKNVRKVKVFNK